MTYLEKGTGETVMRVNNEHSLRAMVKVYSSCYGLDFHVSLSAALHSCWISTISLLCQREMCCSLVERHFWKLNILKNTSQRLTQYSMWEVWYRSAFQKQRSFLSAEHQRIFKHKQQAQTNQRVQVPREHLHRRWEDQQGNEDAKKLTSSSYSLSYPKWTLKLNL